MPCWPSGVFERTKQRSRCSDVGWPTQRGVRCVGCTTQLVGALPGRRPRLRSGLLFVLALEVEGHGSANEILQGRLLDLVAFVDVNRTPDIPPETGVKEM